MPFECHWVYPVELLFDFHIASDKAGHPYTDDIKYCPVEYWFGDKFGLERKFMGGFS